MIGVGTRYSDFTTASRRVFADPDVRFVNLNVAAFDAAKQPARGPGRPTPGAALEAAHRRAGRLAAPSRRTGPSHRGSRGVGRRRAARRTTWATSRCRPRPRSSAWSTRSPATGTSWSARPARMPGDLHKLWRTRDPQGLPRRVRLLLHGLRDRRRPRRQDGRRRSREVFVLVGDGSYLMMAQEIVTAVAGGRQADRRPGPEPRLRLDRRAVGVARARSGSAPATATATRAPGARRRRPARSTWPPTPPASAPT